ncbi:MAG: hypothetical protein COA79_18410 [Planctomycetota bacterium]|nr:MAG: hypothetical protein COA79_18410 [Planctomycetota bacterium]
MSNYKNAVLIIADDWDFIAKCYNNPVVSTPHIDKFSERSITFDNGFCTSPSCAASRACILTGRHSHTHGQYGHCHGLEPFRTHRHMVTIPKVFEEAGLVTGVVGKSHVAPMEEVYPFTYQAIGNLYELNYLKDRVDDFFNTCKNQNFYLHVAFGDPHRRGDNNGFKNEFEIEGFEQPHYKASDVLVPDFLPDEPEVRDDLVEYYEAVSRFDHGVGSVLNALKDQGREKDTLVIVTSDHGMPFPGAKASSFDSGHQCPFLIYTPEIENNGGRHNALMNWVDIAPTIYDWCGLKGPDDLPGRSLIPVLDQPDCEGWDETILSHTFHESKNYNPYRIIRGREFKFIYHCAPELPSPLPTDLFRSPTWQCIKNKNLKMMGKRPTETFLKREAIQLFNIKEDPLEINNLANKPEYKEMVEKMMQKLFKFCLETKDPWMEIPFQKGHLKIDPMKYSKEHP